MDGEGFCEPFTKTGRGGGIVVCQFLGQFFKGGQGFGRFGFLIGPAEFELNAMFGRFCDFIQDIPLFMDLTTLNAQDGSKHLV